MVVVVVVVAVVVVVVVVVVVLVVVVVVVVVVGGAVAVAASVASMCLYIALCGVLGLLPRGLDPLKAMNWRVCLNLALYVLRSLCLSLKAVIWLYLLDLSYLFLFFFICLFGNVFVKMRYVFT